MGRPRLTGLWALLAVSLEFAAVGASPASPAPLFADCRGERTSAPTVILEAGAFGTSADWDYVLDDLAAGGRVCAFDRAGLGQSPPRPGGRDVMAKAQELGDLLDQLGETSPVILVGHSNGALYVRAFADLWPGRVAGLVYVNGVGPEALTNPALIADLTAERREAELAVTAGRLGQAEMVAEILSGPMKLRRPAAALKREGLLRLASLEVARDEDRLVIPGLEAARQLGPVDPRIPIAVIVGAPHLDRGLARSWRAAEVAGGANARQSWILDAPGASHVTPLTRDRAYVTAAVSWLRSLSPGADILHRRPGLGGRQ